MSVFSSEEIAYILDFAADHSLNGSLTEEEQNWKDLGEKINRDWKEIRDVYRSWNMDNSAAGELENTHEHPPTLEVDGNTQMVFMGNYNCDENITCREFIIFNGSELNDQDSVTLIQNFHANNGEGQTNKRQLEQELDDNLMETLKKQSHEELEMKREEHEKKMDLYKMIMDQTAEVHKEKMKILKAKLKEVQKKIHHIDHVMCNINSSKRFKSDQN